VTLKVCAEPGCPVLTKATRCTEHTRAKDRARGTSSERGYGSAHQRLRREYELRMRAGEVFHCWRCAERDVVTEIDPDAWHLGHDDEDRSVYRGPECVPCNEAVAGRTKRT
jgi:hypothetical protein